jgi:hypothetical protein
MDKGWVSSFRLWSGGRSRPLSPLAEEHDQRTAVVAADLLAGGPPVRRGDVDHDHIGRWSVDQLDGRADHGDVAMLAVQGEQLVA